MKRAYRASAPTVCVFAFLLASSPPVFSAGCARLFRRGDSNADGKVDLSDAVSTLGYLFLGNATPSCLEAADADDTGDTDITDAVYTLVFLFASGAAPPAPGPFECGADPTPDALGCDGESPCPIVDPRPEVCDGIDNDCDGIIDCPPGFFCQTVTGDCGGVAVCAEIPAACPKNFDPVCGCNGKTYGNACEAAAAQVGVDHAGECKPGGVCTSNSDCDAADYCEKAVADCRGGGTCAPRPQGCPDIAKPVCGCDGLTYGNACDAAAAGVNVWREGECSFTNCTSNDDCPGDFYCAKAPGDCDGAGTCTIRPQRCPLIFRPVCGCDGVTYGNSCMAAGAGANVMHEGQCGKPRCQTNEECDFGVYCAKDVGDCAGSGVCTEVPATCPDVFDPVCGCDGVTYGNACEAALSGISVQFAGACVPQ